jgi:hypothetical protein
MRIVISHLVSQRLIAVAVSLLSSYAAAEATASIATLLQKTSQQTGQLTKAA